jgi:N6-adenosine-specific RNA methylase IME4
MRGWIDFHTAPDCFLFLWATDPMLPQALKLMAGLGFSYKTVGFYWAKQNPSGKFPIGTGYYTRANPEQCLLGTIGSPKRKSAAVRKLIVAPPREHSRKPDQIYESIEALCHGPYAELFSRTTRPGWSAFGNETGKFNDPATKSNPETHPTR